VKVKVCCHFSKHLAENDNKVDGYHVSEALSMKQANCKQAFVGFPP